EQSDPGDFYRGPPESAGRAADARETAAGHGIADAFFYPHIIGDDSSPAGEVEGAGLGGGPLGKPSPFFLGRGAGDAQRADRSCAPKESQRTRRNYLFPA